MKICIKCKIPQSELEFRKRGSSLQGDCKTCRKAYDKQFYRTRTNKPKKIAKQKEWAKSVKEEIWKIKSAPCMDCKLSFHPVCMDFDHLSNKFMEIAEMIKRKFSLQRILEEVKKCELVCSNCHRLRTFKIRDVAQPG